MSKLTSPFIALLISGGILLGCSAPQSDAPADGVLRSGPALTEGALAGMYMARNSDNADGVEFVECLDNFVLRFDKDADVSAIFTEISAESDAPLEEGNIAYFTDQTQPERFKRLVDEMIIIDGKTEGDIFNFDSSSTCVLSPEDCSLPAKDANTVRLYWMTIEHGSMGCYE